MCEHSFVCVRFIGKLENTMCLTVSSIYKMVMSLNLNHGSVNLVFRLLYCCRLAALFILRCLFLFFIDGLEWNLKKENIQSIKNMMRCRWSYASFKIMQFLNIYCSIVQCVVFSKRQFRNQMILVTEDFIRSFDVDSGVGRFLPTLNVAHCNFRDSKK